MTRFRAGDCLSSWALVGGPRGRSSWATLVSVRGMQGGSHHHRGSAIAKIGSAGRRVARLCPIEWRPDHSTCPSAPGLVLK